MKLKSLLVIAALAFCGSVNAEIYYVVPGEFATGNDGKTWATAITIWDIYAHEASEKKPDAGLTENVKFYNDDVFFFAGGTYYPSPTPAGVAPRIYRGFVFVGGCDPTKGEITDPNWKPEYPSATPTIFSGDLDGNEVASPGDSRNLMHMRRGSTLNEGVTADEGDVYTIVQAEKDGTLRPLRIHGFEFKCCYNEEEFPSSESSSDAAIWGAVDSQQGWIELYNCSIHDNFADKAAGLHVYGSLYRVEDCQFYNNMARQTGAAMRVNINANTRYSRGVVERCAFYNNTLTDRYGAAIALTAGEMYLVNSTVSGNTSFCEGAGIVANGGSRADRKLHLINCTVAGNECTADPAELYKTDAETGAVTNPGSWVGSELRLANDPNCEIWNSIIVGKMDDGTVARAPFVVKDEIKGAALKSLKLSFSIIGTMTSLLEGQMPTLDLDEFNYQNAANTWQAVFADAVLQDNGGNTMTVIPSKAYFDGLAASMIYWPPYVNDATNFATALTMAPLFATTGFAVPNLTIDQRKEARNTGSEDDYAPGAYDFYTTSTGIEDVSLSPAISTREGAIYNLQGMKVNRNYRGLIIREGKKFLVK